MHVWVLTGDKVETAVNIAYSSKYGISSHSDAFSGYGRFELQTVLATHAAAESVLDGRGSRLRPARFAPGESQLDRSRTFQKCFRGE